MRHRGVRCCSHPVRCSLGRICQSWRMRKAATRAFSPSCLRGALDGLADGRAGRRSGLDRLRGETRSPSTARRRRSSSTITSPSIQRCPICTACSRRTKRSSSMPPRRPTGNARISTARICWRAACPSRRRVTAAGSIARSPRSRPAAGSIRRAASRRSASARPRRSSCAAPRRYCRGRHKASCRRATTPRGACSTSTATPT